MHNSGHSGFFGSLRSCCQSATAIKRIANRPQRKSCDAANPALVCVCVCICVCFASALRLLCVKVVDSPTAESRFSARSSPVVYFALFNVNFSLPRLEVLADDDEP